MEDARALLADLVSIDSVNPSLVPGGAGEAEIARFVGGWLEQRGLEVEIADAEPGRPNVVARARGRGGGRTLLLNAHMDTVGYEGMTDPLTARVDGDRMYGRGAYDMKAGLAAIMAAAADAAGRGLAGDVVVAAVCDEELASAGARAVVETVTADGAIVTEPTGEQMMVAVAHKGFTWHEITVHGRAAHGSRPQDGVDAIARMGHVLAAIDDMAGRLATQTGHPLLGPGSIHASIIEGGRELSTYPERCTLSLERRTIPGETVEVVEAELSGLLDGIRANGHELNAELHTTLVRDPFQVDQDAPIVRAALDALGPGTPVIGVPYWADSAVFSAAGIPTVIFGPGGEGAHAAVEWVDLAQLDRCVEALDHVIGAFCA
ncbi:MAG TPA: M20/M25/M40 family metallo-hydrolase [Gaiellales bacterium]|nr:M20/M25/M40 family metallo-hydrolase [Gaiellales bacterium]